MTRFAALLALLIAACHQGSPPTENANGTVTANAAEAQSPIAETGANSTAAERASIPAKFRGIWAEGRAACAQLSHPSRLIISESVIRYPSFVLIGESVDLPANTGIAIKGHNQRTGAPAEAHYSIDETGSILTDEAGGGAVRVRCA